MDVNTQGKCGILTDLLLLFFFKKKKYFQTLGGLKPLTLPLPLLLKHRVVFTRNLPPSSFQAPSKETRLWCLRPQILLWRTQDPCPPITCNNECQPFLLEITRLDQDRQSLESHLETIWPLLNLNKCLNSRSGSVWTAENWNFSSLDDLILSRSLRRIFF